MFIAAPSADTSLSRFWFVKTIVMATNYNLPPSQNQILAAKLT